MSFNQNDTTTGKVYAPGWFLAHEDCVRETREVRQNPNVVYQDMEIKINTVVTRADGTKYVPMGTLVRASWGELLGIAYEDVDVTTGDMPASVVRKGVVYTGRLPSETTQAQESLEQLGFVFVGEPSTPDRPNWQND